jgi:hypothetical protein
LLLKSYQLHYCIYAVTELCANAGIKCPELVCLKHILVCISFNTMLEFPNQIFAAFTNIMQKMGIGTEC